MNPICCGDVSSSSSSFSSKTARIGFAQDEMESLLFVSSADIARAVASDLSGSVSVVCVPLPSFESVHEVHHCIDFFALCLQLPNVCDVVDL